MCLCLNFVLIDDYAFVYLFLLIQNAYAYLIFWYINLPEISYGVEFVI